MATVSRTSGESTRRAAAWMTIAIAACAGCTGPIVSSSPAAPVASQQLPSVRAGRQASLGGFLAGPQGRYVNVPASYLFSLNSAVIRPSAAAGLRELLPAISRGSGPVMIYGYTDGLGAAAYNKALSQERADAVARWLIGNHIDQSRIQAKGMGEATDAIDPAQRRVEIVLP